MLNYYIINQKIYLKELYIILNNITSLYEIVTLFMLIKQLNATK